MVHNENKVIIPLLGVIFLISVAIVAIQNFTNTSFGALGFIAWIIVIVGAFYSVLWGLAQIFC